MSCLVSCTAIGPRAAMRAAMSSAASSAVPADTVRCNNPARSAAAASSRSPASAMSLTGAGPISRTRRCVPDHPGTTPTSASGRPNTAPAPPMRRSHVAASSSPPPSAKPSIAAIRGGRSRAMRSNTAWPSRTQWRHMSSGPLAAQASISAPTQKARWPVALRTTTRMSSSPSMRPTASPSAVSIAGVSALSLSGRSSVMRAT